MKSRTKSSTLEISTAADAEDSKPSRDGLATDNVLAGALLEFSMVVSVVLRVTVMVNRHMQLLCSAIALARASAMTSLLKGA